MGLFDSITDAGSLFGLEMDVGDIVDIATSDDPYTAAIDNYVGDMADGLGGIIGDQGTLNDGTNTQGTIDRIPGTGGGGRMNGGYWLPEDGRFIRTGGLGAGVVALGAYMARRFGASGIASATAKIGNKVFKMAQLWPLVNKYGGRAVATALGISMGALGHMLMEAPKTPRRRRRGLTWRQLSNAKRTVRVLRSMDHSFAKAGGGFRRRSSSRTSSRGSTIIAQN